MTNWFVNLFTTDSKNPSDWSLFMAPEDLDWEQAYKNYHDSKEGAKHD